MKINHKKLRAKAKKARKELPVKQEEKLIRSLLDKAERDSKKKKTD